MLCHNDSHRAFVPGLAGGDVDADADAGAGAGAGAGIYRPSAGCARSHLYARYLHI